MRAVLAREQTLCLGKGCTGEKRLRACRQTFGTLVPRHPLCNRSWCKHLLARTLTVDRFDLHPFFGRQVGLPSSFLASRSFAAQRSRGRALPSLNLNKKKDCSPSTTTYSSSILLLSFVLLLISIFFLSDRLFRWTVSASLHFWPVFGLRVSLLGCVWPVWLSTK